MYIRVIYYNQRGGDYMTGYVNGYWRADEDIRVMGYDWTKNLLELRKKCTGLDNLFTMGYQARVEEEA